MKMAISKEEYAKALKIVQAYEEQERYYEELFEDDDDERDWELEEEEAEEERRMEIASICTCGAWVIGKDGRAYHVADCYCGAE